MPCTSWLVPLGDVLWCRTRPHTAAVQCTPAQSTGTGFSRMRRASVYWSLFFWAEHLIQGCHSPKHQSCSEQITLTQAGKIFQAVYRELTIRSVTLTFVSLQRGVISWDDCEDGVAIHGVVEQRGGKGAWPPPPPPPPAHAGPGWP